MLVHCLALELPVGASETDVRQRYLQRIREYPPGRDPEPFQKVSAAYEALGDRRTRIRASLFGYADYGDWKLALDALAEAKPDKRSMPGLRDLLVAEGVGQARTEDDGRAG